MRFLRTLDPTGIDALPGLPRAQFEGTQAVPANVVEATVRGTAVTDSDRAALRTGYFERTDFHQSINLAQSAPERADQSSGIVDPSNKTLSGDEG